MKIAWDAKDIKGGRRLVKPGTAEIWMIGYTPNPEDGPSNLFAMVSTVDGAITKFKTPDEMAKNLNAGGYVPVEVAALPYFEQK